MKLFWDAFGSLFGFVWAGRGSLRLPMGVPEAPYWPFQTVSFDRLFREGGVADFEPLSPRREVP